MKTFVICELFLEKQSFIVWGERRRWSWGVNFFVFATKLKI